MEVNLRSRYLSLPDIIMDSWFFDEDAAPGHLDRPKVMAWVVGLEYVLRRTPSNGIFYIEYMGSAMNDGYWDDKEEPPDYNDGDYIVPEHLGMVLIGGDYAWELIAENWLSFLFGGGIGLGIVTGGMTQWYNGANATGDITCQQGDGRLTSPQNATAYERFISGCGDDGSKDIPAVLPIVDINLAVKFNVSHRASLRVEAGLHDLLYVGLSAGVSF